MRIAPAFCLLFVAGACAAGPLAQDAAEPPGGEIAAALAGRVEGATVSCVDSRDLRGSQALAGGEAILFETRGSLVYLNRPRGGCSGITRDLALSTTTQAARLCAGDIVQAFDAQSGVAHASCSLGPFTAYTRSR